MDKNKFDMKKVIVGIVFVIAIALGIVNPSDLLSGGDEDTVETTQTVSNQETEEQENTTETSEEIAASEEETEQSTEAVSTSSLTFRNDNLLQQHYEKHGIEMGFVSAEEYEAAAAAVVVNPEALHKTEAEDGDDVYYVESTNEFVVVSTDGYLRTYFNPSRGIDYYNAQ